MFLDGGLRNDEGSAFERNRARVRLDLPLGNRIYSTLSLVIW